MIGTHKSVVLEAVGLHVRSVENLQMKLSPSDRAIFIVAKAIKHH